MGHTRMPCITFPVAELNWQGIIFVGLALYTRAFAGTAEPPPPTTQTNLADAIVSAILYIPRAYKPADIDQFLQAGGTRLDYKTSSGNQTAWLMNPADGGKPQRLWVVCGGNGSLALEAVPFLREMHLRSDAFLLVDYPGYGCCEGHPTPESIRANVRASILAAAGPAGIDAIRSPQLVCVFGHSLGCAVALMAVEEFHLKSAVLCAPFTSTHEMAERMIGIPKNAPFHHQFDNRLGMEELRKNSGHAWIFHGADDEIIPVDMSRTLADEFRDVVKLRVVDSAHHDDVMLIARDRVEAAMAAARK
jgi:predicted alpha/beta hydrolase family esterase